ncbi:uncharacterized protein LOC134257156 [Saccostrea cucullata]|uniref:uncharacterized protein LOC134257156 n=1 Tax=Saccostrea cuccullata TaxID=36930 RepID=UPI002ED0B9B0
MYGGSGLRYSGSYSSLFNQMSRFAYYLSHISYYAAITNYKSTTTTTRSPLSSVTQGNFPFQTSYGSTMARKRKINPLKDKSTTTTTRSPLSSVTQVSTPSPAVKGQTLPSFIVQMSKVNICFDLSLKKSRAYNVIKMAKQNNGCTILANTASKQNRALKTFASLKVEKFRGKRMQETINVDVIKNLTNLQCDMDGITLDVEKDQHGLRLKAEMHGRQRKQYDGILSHFVNMKCKIVRQFSRKGKLMAKVKCRRRGRPTLKFKAIQKTSSSGDSCWFLNKRMVNSLNISPTNYEITP